MTTNIQRHPDDATLMSFAAGTLPEPLAAIVATHIAMCARCRREMRALDALGGMLLMRMPDSGAKPMQRPAFVPAASHAHREGVGQSDLLPPALAARLGIGSNGIVWTRMAPGIKQMRLPLAPGVMGDLRLLNIRPGRKMPEHGHGGTELTLVLDGAFHDATGYYRRGDVQDVDSDIEHQPIVDSELGCICLVASEQPARFKGIFSKLLQPLTGM